MPVRIEHLSKYKHNKEFLKNSVLSESKNIDWAIVVAFYSALHLIEAFLAGNDIHCRGHQNRSNWIFLDSRLRKLSIPEYYNMLYNQSIRARYDCVTMDKNDLKAVNDALSFIEAQLYPELGIAT